MCEVPAESPLQSTVLHLSSHYICMHAHQSSIKQLSTRASAEKGKRKKEKGTFLKTYKWTDEEISSISHFALLHFCTFKKVKKAIRDGLTCLASKCINSILIRFLALSAFSKELPRSNFLPHFTSLVSHPVSWKHLQQQHW